MTNNQSNLVGETGIVHIHGAFVNFWLQMEDCSSARARAVDYFGHHAYKPFKE